MIRKRYYALKDALGFPIPGTMRGYNADPCRCELVELRVPTDEPSVGDAERRFHPGGLHYFYQVDRACCNVLPNSLIASKQRPKGRYVEFVQYIDEVTEDGGSEVIILTDEEEAPEV